MNWGHYAHFYMILKIYFYDVATYFFFNSIFESHRLIWERLENTKFPNNNKRLAWVLNNFFSDSNSEHLAYHSRWRYLSKRVGPLDHHLLSCSPIFFYESIKTRIEIEPIYFFGVCETSLILQVIQDGLLFSFSYEYIIYILYTFICMCSLMNF